jgi:dinuclear metal center YbgI/SA1388 family protein
MLDNRLKMCADMVGGDGIVCDVGTDHAYLAAELVLSGKCHKVIASDLREGPLEAAARTVEKHGLSDKIELILSDGLKDVPLDGVSDIVIAGMGGETIVEILEGCERDFRNINLVLQPMTKADVLRMWLVENGFVISREAAVEDGDKVYIVMSVPYRDEPCGKLSEYMAVRGFVDADDPAGKKYLANQSRLLQKKADALEASGKYQQAVHFHSMAQRILSDDVRYTSADEVYDYLDSLYPVSTQEKWDNSGFLVNSGEDVGTILLTLDIDNNAVNEAIDLGADLIVSHHPVIFEPIKKISYESPVYKMIYSGISAICMHTNLDKSPEGTNGVILRKIQERLEIESEPEIFEQCADGLGIGYVCELKNEIGYMELGAILKQIFGCQVVRVSRNYSRGIKRFAFCSGSGGSMLELAAEKNCDAYITGDVKHDVWIAAENMGITLFDCGHFHTENIVLEELRYVLEKKFPQIDIIIAESSSDPTDYIR